MPAEGSGSHRILLDAMVMAAGLTSQRQPASFSRQLVTMAIDGEIELVLTERLLDEVAAVLSSRAFEARVERADVASLLASMVTAAAFIIADRFTEAPRMSADPDDDYLVVAALRTGAFLVSRDERADFGSVQGLRTGRPGTALRMLGVLEVPGEEA